MKRGAPSPRGTSYAHRVDVTLAVTFVAAAAAEAKVTVTCLTHASHHNRQDEPTLEKFKAMRDEIDVVYRGTGRKLYRYPSAALPRLRHQYADRSRASGEKPAPIPGAGPRQTRSDRSS